MRNFHFKSISNIEFNWQKIEREDKTSTEDQWIDISGYVWLRQKK